MSWLGSLLVSLFASIAGFLAREITQKIALGMAAVAVFAGLTTTFVLIAKAALSAAFWAMPSWMAAGAAVLVPSNLPACVSVVVSVRVTRWVYDYHVANLKLVSYIT